MSRLAHLVIVVLAFGCWGCSRKPVGAEQADGGGGRGASAGTRGDGGGGGTNIGAAGTSAGSRGGAMAGSGGSAMAGAAGGTIAGAGGSATGGTGGALAPIRLLIFYTRWGTNYPDWWPSGSERDFTMSAMLQALEPFKSELMLLSGLTNANVLTAMASPMLMPALGVDGGPSPAVSTLLTARPSTPAGTAQGPSLDTLIGDCGGAAGPPLRLAVGQFGYDDNPGVSFAMDGTSLPGERDPTAVAMRVLGHPVSSPDPNGDINANYPGIGAAQMAIAAEALETLKTCVVTLMWGDDFVPTFLGLTLRVHELSHTGGDLFAAVLGSTSAMRDTPFSKLQRFYAQQFASLLGRLRAIPLGGGTLLDQSVVIWISETGDGPNHLGRYIPVVIAGRGGARLDVGRFFEIKPHMFPTGGPDDFFSITRTQGDLLAALAQIWGIPSFGDPAIVRQPLAEILRP